MQSTLYGLMISAGVKTGDEIQVEDFTARNIEGGKPQASRHQKYISTLKSAAKPEVATPTVTSTPTTPQASPEITPKQSKATGCQLDPMASGASWFMVLGALSLLTRRRT
jgi:hypothetical protein